MPPEIVSTELMCTSGRCMTLGTKLMPGFCQLLVLGDQPLIAKGLLGACRGEQAWCIYKVKASSWRCQASAAVILPTEAVVPRGREWGSSELVT